MSRLIFVLIFFCFYLNVRSQETKGIDEPRRYYIEPAEYALNNRWYADCRAACTNRANHNISCSEYRITAQKHKPADSALIAIYYFGANGFVDSAWFAEQQKPFKYTKAGERTVKNMQCDCNDITLARGQPGSTTVEGADRYMRCTRSFDAAGYLEEQVDMKNGFIKYNDSPDGSWNVKTEFVIDSAENLRMKTTYLSHTRFFRHPQRQTVYYYDAHNNFTGRREYDYEDGSVEQYRLVYTTK